MSDDSGQLCVRFNKVAADAKSRYLDIRSLWAWYTLDLNISVEFEHLQARVMSVTRYFDLFNHTVQCGHMGISFY